MPPPTKKKEFHKRNQTNLCRSHYRSLYRACGRVLTVSFRAHGDLQCQSHNSLSDFEKWLPVFSSRPEGPMFNLASREYQFGLLALGLGKYRTAYTSLRGFLEMALSMVQFSAHEFKLREWLKGKRDVNWKSIVDNENGIFSKNFTNAFREELVEEVGLYGSLASKIYRECSEYVHANAISPIPASISFDEKLFTNWHEKAKTAMIVTHFSFFLRYSCVLTEEQIRTLEPVLLSELGHIEAIREHFGATV